MFKSFFTYKILKIIIMKKILGILVIQALISGVCLNAQKIKMEKGSLDFLKGQKSLLLSYDYSNMGVGKFEKEEDYIAKKQPITTNRKPGKVINGLKPGKPTAPAAMSPNLKNSSTNTRRKSG